MSTNYYNELQATYLGLFDRPADGGGENYWNSQATSSTGPGLTATLNDIASFAQYNGAPITSSNIASEIVNIYSDMLGVTVTPTNSGVEYWAGLFNGNNLGTIINDIYTIVENISPGAPNYYDQLAMNDKIASATAFTETNPTATPSNSPTLYATATASINGMTAASVMPSQTIDITPGQSSYTAVAGEGPVTFVVNDNSNPSPSSNLIPTVPPFYDTLNANGNVGTLDIYAYPTKIGADPYTATSQTWGINYFNLLPSTMTGINTIEFNNQSMAVNVSNGAAAAVPNIIVNNSVSDAFNNDTSGYAFTDPYRITSAQNFTYENTNYGAIIDSTGTSANVTLNNVNATGIQTIASAQAQTSGANSGVTQAEQTININGLSMTTLDLTSENTNNITLTNYVPTFGNGVPTTFSSLFQAAPLTTVNLTGVSGNTLSIVDSSDTLDNVNANGTSTISGDAGTVNFTLPNFTPSSSTPTTFAFTGDSAAGSGVDTLTVLASPIGAGTTTPVAYTLTGGSNAGNAIDVGYNAAGTYLAGYLGSGTTNFATLDFNYENTSVSGFSFTTALDLSKVNSDFTTFKLDNTFTLSGDTQSYTFTNAASTDTFNVQAATNTLTISDTAPAPGVANETTVDITGTSTAGITLDALDLYNSTTVADSPTAITIDNTGGVSTSANIISSIDLADNSSVNITGSGYLDINGLTDSGTNSVGFSVNTSSFTGDLTLAVPGSSNLTVGAFDFTGGTGTENLILGGGAASGVAYSMTGNTSGTNTIEVNYAAGSNNYNTSLPQYLDHASNFQMLDFTTHSATTSSAGPAGGTAFTAGGATGGASLNVGTAGIGTGDFTTFDFNSTGNSVFTFTNVLNNDTFNINADTTYLNIVSSVSTTENVNVAAGVTVSDELSVCLDVSTLNLKMGGGDSIVNMAMPSLTWTSGTAAGFTYESASTINLNSTGSTGASANIIGTTAITSASGLIASNTNSDGGFYLVNGATLNISGSESLTINNLFNASPSSAQLTGAAAQTGFTVNAGTSASPFTGNLTFNYFDNPLYQPTTPISLNNTINLANTTGKDTITQYGNGNDTITFGTPASGNTDTFTQIGNGNDIVTFGSGAGSDVFNHTGSGSDAFTLGSGSDTVVGISTSTTGNGGDTITVTSSAPTAVDTIIAGAVYSGTGLTASSTLPLAVLTTIDNTTGGVFNSSDAIGFSANNATTPTTIGSFSLLNESSAVSLSAAISSVITALQTTDAGGIKDAAASFQYGTNTYIVNDYNSYASSANTYTDQVVKLTGVINLSGATISGNHIVHI